MCLFTNAVFILHPGQILPRSGCNGTPGTVKSLNAAMGVVQLALRQDYAKKIDPCRMLVWQSDVLYRIWSGQCTLLSGRPVKTGQVLFEFKFTTAQSDLFGSIVVILSCLNSHQITRFRSNNILFASLSLRMLIRNTPLQNLWKLLHDQSMKK